MIRLRDTIVSDPVALHKWPMIVDHIVASEVDRLSVKELLAKDQRPEAILKSLNLWESNGTGSVDLIKVLRDYKLNSLADTILEDKFLASVMGMGTEPQKLTLPSRKAKIVTGVWFEVGEVVYNFAGREIELGDLHLKLTTSHSTKSGTANIVSICGLGGIGKSTLAREYAHRYRIEYDGNVIWINAQTSESMRASLVRLAMHLGMGPRECDHDQDSSRSLANRIYGKFQDRKSLFIFDNVEEKSYFNFFRPKIEDPSRETPYILITTRRNDVAPAARSQLLDVLTMGEATDLVLAQLPHVHLQSAIRLADKLQRFPLAIQQALALIRDKYPSDDDCITEYLKEFESSERELLKDEKFRENSDYSPTTYATFMLALTRLRNVDGGGGEGAIRVIHTLAYVNPDLISRSFVKSVFKNCDDEDATHETASVDVQLGLKLLERCSMISVKDGRIGIHRLVQHVTRLSLSSKDESSILEQLIRAISAQFDRDEFTEYSRECMSHGLNFFPFLLKRDQLMSQRSTAGYLSNLCYFLIHYQNYSDCLVIAEQTASFYESAERFGPAHEDTLMMKWRLASAHYHLHNYSDAMNILEPIHQLVSQSDLECLGPEHWLTMSILSSMAAIHSANGDHQKAVEIYDQIIPVQTAQLGEGHNTVLLSKHNKAIALRKVGKLDEASELYQTAYEQRLELYGRNDLRTLSVRESAGHIPYRKGEFGAAVEIWTEVYEGYVRVVGEQHPYTTRVKKNIGKAEAGAKTAAEAAASANAKSDRQLRPRHSRSSLRQRLLNLRKCELL